MPPGRRASQAHSRRPTPRAARDPTPVSPARWQLPGSRTEQRPAAAWSRRPLPPTRQSTGGRDRSSWGWPFKVLDATSSSEQPTSCALEVTAHCRSRRRRTTSDKAPLVRGRLPRPANSTAVVLPLRHRHDRVAQTSSSLGRKPAGSHRSGSSAVDLAMFALTRGCKAHLLPLRSRSGVVEKNVMTERDSKRCERQAMSAMGRHLRAPAGQPCPNP
jgi:hypothetical protein